MTPKKTYADKLKDPRWQKKRLEILNRDKFTCKYCQDDKTTLHIHHLEYYGNPWQADSDKLITLCEHCHSIIEFDEVTGNVIGCIKQVVESSIFMTVVFDQNEKRFAVVYEINKDGVFLQYAMNRDYLKDLNRLWYK